MVEHDLLLSSGKRIYAHCGLLSVPAFGDIDRDRLHHGYDGAHYFDGVDANREPLTQEERVELANHMIQRWREWAG